MELQACLRAGSVRPLFRGFHLTFVRIGEIFTLRRGRSFFCPACTASALSSSLRSLRSAAFALSPSAPQPSRPQPSLPPRSRVRSLRALAPPLSPLRCHRALAFAPFASPLPSFRPLHSRSRARSLRSAAFALSRSLPSLRPLHSRSRARSLRSAAFAPLSLLSRARPLRGVWWRAVLSVVFVLFVLSVVFSARATLLRPSVWLKNPKTREAEPLLYLLRVAPSLFRLSLSLCVSPSSITAPTAAFQGKCSGIEKRG